MVILQQMIIFFILTLIGVYSRKKGLINSDNQKQLSGIVINIGNPAMIISGSMDKENLVPANELLLSLLIATGIFAIMIFLAFFIPKLFGFSHKHHGIVKLMLIFSNIGFMGMPMVSSIYGTKALMYVTVFLLPFNILVYTYGIYVLQKNNKASKENNKLSNILNIGVISCFISIILYFLPIETPYFISETIYMLSKITGPLSMMIIGASMLDIKWKEVFSDFRLILFSILKMIILPIIMLFILKGIINNNILLGVSLIMLATPVGSMTAMLASQYNEESYPLAAKGVAMTTVMSVVTIPLISLITGI